MYRGAGELAGMPAAEVSPICYRPAVSILSRLPLHPFLLAAFAVVLSLPIGGILAARATQALYLDRLADADRFATLAEVGVQHVILNMAGVSAPGNIETFGREILPKVHALEPRAI